VIAEWLAVCSEMLAACAHDAPETPVSAGTAAIPMRAENHTANFVLEFRRRATLRTALATIAINVPAIRQFTI